MKLFTLYWQSSCSHSIGRRVLRLPFDPSGALTFVGAKHSPDHGRGSTVVGTISHPLPDAGSGAARQWRSSTESHRPVYILREGQRLSVRQITPASGVRTMRVVSAAFLV